MSATIGHAQKVWTIFTKHLWCHGVIGDPGLCPVVPSRKHQYRKLLAIVHHLGSTCSFMFIGVQGDKCFDKCCKPLIGLG
jgi:hypothetical protein